ncbi:MAG: glutamate synthase subunit beta, partial [Kiritimatiellae bacterium]|nr:glutamate synthase subunit beta [Kiritimatiellia bacterium]
MKRIHDIYRPMEERKSDWNEVERSLTDDELKEQTSRCMNCGQPFCHAYGCPLGNLVPDQNRAVAQGDWKRAYDLLSQNSDFPEFTSRICPALCEASCVHQLDEESVMVRQSEKRIIETAFNYGWVVPRPPTQENGKKVAIIGAG